MPDFRQICFFRQIFIEAPPPSTKFRGNPSSGMSVDKYRESNVQKDGRTDMTKTKGASSEYAKLPKKREDEDSELKVDEPSPNLFYTS